MPGIETYIEAAGSAGHGSGAELDALRSIVTTLGTILGEEARAAVGRDDAIADNLEFNLYEGQEQLDRASPETWLLAARQHGEDSEPDHEFGDLQEIAQAAWRQATPSDIDAFEATEIAMRLAPVPNAPRA